MLAVAARVLAGTFVPAAFGQQAAEENSVKAAFVYNFAKFAEWPAEVWNKPGKLRICLAGPRNGLYEAVSALDAKQPVRGKEVEVRALSRPEEAGACHVLVLTVREGAATLWIHATNGAPLLTVGVAAGFAESGGVVGLFVEDEKVRFEVNQDAAQRANLRFSSQLLKLARIVKDNPRPGTP